MLTTGLSFILDVYLGVTLEERKILQAVEVNFEFQNSKIAQCKDNDDASDYLCYQSVITNICNDFDKKEVKLLEYLCNQIYKIVKERLDKGLLVNVFVKKKCINIIDDKDADAFCKYTEF